MLDREKIEKDSRYLRGVIEGCQTKDQLRSAYRYFQLWQLKYKTIMNLPMHGAHQYFFWIDGNASGRLIEKSKQIKS